MRSVSQTKAKAAWCAALAAAGLVLCTNVRAAEEPAHPAALDTAIIAAAKRHGVPEHLVRRIIMRESKYNPTARNHRYWGLMQISYPTARSMGFKGSPQELLNPVVNLRYAVPYLANAFVIAGKREDAAVRLYAAGYYFTARTRGLLSALRTANSTPLNGVVDEPTAQPVLAANASAQPPESFGVFGALFSPGQQPEAPPQPAAYSADASVAAQPQSQQQPPVAAETAAAPSGTFRGKTLAMEVTKNGDLAPPKKWRRDGGTTLIARGDQPLDRMASRDSGAEQAESGHTSHRHAHKITLIAAVDEPPGTAQAYAAAPGQDPRFAGAASQTAIAQATSGAPAAPQTDIFGQPITPPQPQEAAQPQPPQAATPAAAAPGNGVQVAAGDDEKPAKHHRSRHAHRHKSSDATQVAEQKASASPAPELRPSQTQTQ